MSASSHMRYRDHTPAEIANEAVCLQDSDAAPHLLKTAHNCFINYFAHSKNRKMQVIPPPPSLSLSHISSLSFMLQFMSL